MGTLKTGKFDIALMQLLQDFKTPIWLHILFLGTSYLGNTVYINKSQKVCTVWLLQGVHSAKNLCTHPCTVPIMINYSTVQEYWEIISGIIFPFLALRI